MGQRVEVEAYQERRPAVITSCDRGLWVQYPSGIEEQISPSRLKADQQAQAR